MGAINIGAVVRSVEQAEVAAITNVCEAIERDARARAPVRKVFKEKAGFKRHFRPLTDAERSLAIKRAAAHPYSTDFQKRAAIAHIRYYARAEIPRRSSANSLKNSRTLRTLGYLREGTFQSRVVTRLAGSRGRQGVIPGAFSTRPNSPTQGGYNTPSLNSRLTARGRYEVRSGRAITYQALDSGHVRVQIGGRLKRSIHAEPPVTGDNETVGQVVAGVRYAKFVEFPTTHNAAQPFLLPALQDHREHLRRELTAEIQSRLGGSS